MKPEHAGTVGWATLGVGVILWDVLAPETLSSAADRALVKHPALTFLAIGAVSLHLLNEFDHLHLERYDLLNKLGRLGSHGT